MRLDGFSQPLFGFIGRSLGRSSAWLSSLAISQFSTSCGYNHGLGKYLRLGVDADANEHPAPDLSSGSVESDCLLLNANAVLLYCLGNDGGSHEEPIIGCGAKVPRIDLQGQTSRAARHEGLNLKTDEGFVVNAGNDRKPAKSVPSSGSGGTRPSSRLQKRIRRRQQSKDTPDDQLHRDRHGQDDDSGTETGRKLACPFFKHDRVRHFDCLPFTLKRVKDVKQHILRKHPAEQNSALSDNLKNPSSETAKWFAIWDILFPHQRRPNSPFIENEVEEAIMMVKEFWDKHADEAIPAVTRQVGLQDAMHDSLLPGSDQVHNQWRQDSSATSGVPNREVIGSLLRELAKISKNRPEEGSSATLSTQETEPQHEPQTIIDNTTLASEEPEMSLTAYLHMNDLEETGQSPLTNEVFDQSGILSATPWNTEYAQNEGHLEDSIMSGQEGFAQEPFELNSWPEEVIDDHDLSFVDFDFDVDVKKEE